MKTQNITKHKIAPGCFEVIDKRTGKVLGRYGGRDGAKWATTAACRPLTEDSPVSVGVLVGLIVAAAEKVAGGISAAHFLAQTIPAQRVVSHPDGAGFALLDVYGDFYRSHHGFVFKFVTKDLAGKMLGLFDENHPLI